MKTSLISRYDYINTFILDYIVYSMHVSEVGGFYWYIIALQVGEGFFTIYCIIFKTATFQHQTIITPVDCMKT